MPSTSTLVFLSALAAGALAQTAADLPACSTQCFIEAIGQSSCGLTDTECQCTEGQETIAAALIPCLCESTCTDEELLTVNEVSNGICSAAVDDYTPTEADPNACGASDDSESSSTAAAAATTSAAASAASSVASSAASAVSSAVSSVASSAASAVSSATAAVSGSASAAASGASSAAAGASSAAGSASASVSVEAQTANAAAATGMPVALGLIGMGLLAL